MINNKKIIITSNPKSMVTFDYFEFYLEWLKIRKRMERLQKLKIIFDKDE